MTERFEEFVLTHADAIARGILSKVSATYHLDPGPDADRAKLLRRRLYPAQLHCAAAIARRLRSHPDALLTGEPSTGKTVTGIAVAWMLQAQRILVVTPAHLLTKWRREILQTLPSAEVVEIRTISDANTLLKSARPTPGRPICALVSRDIAKLDAHWTPAAHPRWTTGFKRKDEIRPGIDLPQTIPIGSPDHIPASVKVDPETNQPQTVFRCPDCYQPLGKWHKEGRSHTWEWWDGAYLETAIRKCPHCQAVLARRYPRGKGAFPIARYLARRHPEAFDLALVDELHRHRGANTAQGMALTWVSQASRRVVGITATLTSGRPGSVFHLLHRLSREFRNTWRHGDAAAFAREHGLVRRIWDQDPDPATAGRRSSRKEAIRPRLQEIPGLSPAILRYVLDRTAFIRLADLRMHLPQFDEIPSPIAMTTEQRDSHKQLLHALSEALHSDLRRRRGAALAAKLHLLLTWPDTPWRPLWEIADDDGTLTLAPLPEDETYPKEKTLIETCRAEATAGRKVLVYCTHTGENGPVDRTTRLLRQNGLRATTLSASVTARNRERWIDKHAPGLDALITSPRLVGEGLDLLQFPTIVWLEPEYDVYVVRQASRRSWRLGQTQPVKIFHLYYHETAQEHAVRLVARGVSAATAIDGDVTEAAAGLARMAGTEIVYDLARAMLGQVGGDDLATILRRAHEAETQAATAIDGSTIAAGWTMEIKPAPRRQRNHERHTHAQQTTLF